MKKTTVILSGIPGRMCREIAMLFLEQRWLERFELADFAFTSPAHDGRMIEVTTGVTLQAVSLHRLESVRRRATGKQTIVIDFTTPAAALGNADIYIDAALPFVMGTTGFDREEMLARVKASPLNAVIAPNMAAPIVMIQSALCHAAEQLGGALDGYKLAIRESHQATKRDPSGTARALLPAFEQLGCKPADPPIRSIRDAEQQRKLGVPGAHLDGHGWHWYEAVSPAGDVTIDLSHRVNGRRVYAEGALVAAEFLAKRTRSGKKGIVYTMEEVLRG